MSDSPHDDGLAPHELSLGVFGITVTLVPVRQADQTIKLGGSIRSDLRDREDEDCDVIEELLFNARIDGLESFILAAACSGVDVCSSDFREAIETTVAAISNGG